MKIVFWGTSEFAARILSDLLAKSFEIVAVVTRLDMPQGRSLHLSPPPVKKFLIESGSKIPVHQPEKASTLEFSQILSSYNADLFLVVAYGEILRQNILDIPIKGCINIHTSLLPKYRGAAPIQRCLMDGSRESGITIIEMVRQMDAGDILAQSVVPIPENMNFGQLEEALLQECFTLVPKMIHDFDQYYKNKTSQDVNLVTFAAKILPVDMEINWNDSAQKNHDKIRALSPYPGAYCKVKIGDEFKRLKIKSSFVRLDLKGDPGSILSLNRELIIACSQGSLSLGDVQLEGKKMMTASDFLKGIHQKISFSLPDSSL
ncbi:MAG: methionyl-tRNA formyltransferase [Chlamydiae bacterium]|nr:methionyl-tRNA formyltransferase [Chlamydiota bacterium]